MQKIVGHISSAKKLTGILVAIPTITGTIISIPTIKGKIKIPKSEKIVYLETENNFGGQTVFIGKGEDSLYGC